MDASLTCEALLLLDDTAVLGWSEEALVLLGVSGDRLASSSVTDLLAPWPGTSDGDRAPLSWKAEITGTGTQVRCRAVPFRGAEGSRTVLHLLPERDAQRLEQDATLLRALFSQAKVGLAVHDADLKVTRVSLNARFQAREGSMLEPVGGHALTETLLAEDAAEITELLGGVLETGEALVEVPQRARPSAQPVVERFVSLSAIPLTDADDRPCGVVATFTDITDEHRAKEGRLLIGDAARRIGSDLDPITCAQELVDVVVPGFADAAAVDLVETVLAGDEPGPALSGPVAKRVAVSGRGDLLPDGPEAGGLGGSAPRATVPGPSRGASMIVALRARGQTLGRVVMHRLPGRAGFDSLDTEVAEEIVSRTALIIDNARQYVRERRTVEALRRSLLPPPPDETCAARVELCHVAAAVPGTAGSAWVDVVSLSSARVAFVAGTTTGRGIEAAAAAGRLRTAIQTLSDLDLAPEELLTHVDELVRRRLSTDERHTGDEGTGETGATCLYAVYDPVAGRFAMASAGHPAPTVIAPGGHVSRVPVVPGPALGVGGVPFEPVELAVEPGSVLLLLAGEAVEPVPTGSPGPEGIDLGGFLRSAVRDLSSVRAGKGGAGLAARVRSLPEGSTAFWQYEADPTVVAQAREAVAHCLAAWDLDDLAFPTELIVSELVTNAIRYAGGPIGLRLIKDRSLICEVSDPSQTQPHLRHARLMDEGGRGLFLIHQFTEQWGSRYTGAGKTIWTTQCLTGQKE